MQSGAHSPLFEHLLESAPDAIVIVDEYGRIVLANSQAERLFGYEHSDLKGKPIETLIPESLSEYKPADRHFSAWEPTTRSMETGLELLGRRNDGTDFPAEISISPVRTSQGSYVTTVIRDISSRKCAEERLKASLREKDVLLQEIHHRVKNNLQVISSIINLQAVYVSDEGTRRILNDTRGRVRSIALVHERLYVSKNFSDVDLRAYIEGLVADICGVYDADNRRLLFELTIAQTKLDIDKVINFGLIIHELVSNAIKYAFPGAAAGTISVELVLAGTELVLTVADTGVGFPREFSWRETQTLGLRLVEGLVAELDGRLEVSDNQPKGLRFRVSAPL